jgi:hypothetical protein
VCRTVEQHRGQPQNFSLILSVSRSVERRLGNAPVAQSQRCCAIACEVIMSISEYEERFRPPAPSIHQIFAATGGRRREPRRRRRSWVVAAAVGVLTVTYMVASPHAGSSWRIGHTRITACQGQGSATMISDQFRVIL